MRLSHTNKWVFDGHLGIIFHISLLFMENCSKLSFYYHILLILSGSVVQEDRSLLQVGKIGMIGDRAIVIKSSSEIGYPILKIFKPKRIPLGKDKDEPVSFDIVYKKY